MPLRAESPLLLNVIFVSITQLRFNLRQIKVPTQFVVRVVHQVPPYLCLEGRRCHARQKNANDSTTLTSCTNLSSEHGRYNARQKYPRWAVLSYCSLRVLFVSGSRCRAITTNSSDSVAPPPCIYDKKNGQIFRLVLFSSGSGTRTTRPSGYEPDELPTAPSRDVSLLL